MAATQPALELPGVKCRSLHNSIIESSAESSTYGSDSACESSDSNFWVSESATSPPWQADIHVNQGGKSRTPIDIDHWRQVCRRIGKIFAEFVENDEDEMQPTPLMQK